MAAPRTAPAAPPRAAVAPAAGRRAARPARRQARAAAGGVSYARGLEVFNGATESGHPLSVYLVGRDTRLLANVAALLGPEVGYTPLSTHELLSGAAAGTPIEALVADQGEVAAVEGEASVLEALSVQLRLVVGTWGGVEPHGMSGSGDGCCGAAGEAGEWRWLHGGVCVFVDCGAPWGASELVRAKADCVARYLDGDSPEEVLPKVVAAIAGAIEADDELLKRKGMYTKFGCRGDWPELKPPGWDPEKPDEIDPYLPPEQRSGAGEASQAA